MQGSNFEVWSVSSSIVGIVPQQRTRQAPDVHAESDGHSEPGTTRAGVVEVVVVVVVMLVVDIDVVVVY